jgi:alkanesulfonate monooxygenase SsuD/methylene tetrahydromethanopterin reductase-like flavin-dependent oxidoreductase (luciferase family)
VGSLEDEFALLDAEWAERGAQADDALRALRVALSQPEPSYRGPYFEFGGLVVDPRAVQEHVPIWVGGRTGRSLRRATALADGWAPFGLRTAELRVLLDRARESADWMERTQPLEVIVQNDRPFDPAGEPGRVAEQLAKYAELGATSLAARLVHHSFDHYCEQLAALAELA